MKELIRIQERAAQIMREDGVDEALARRPAPMPDMMLIMRSTAPPEELVHVVREAIAHGHWDEAMRREASAQLRATFELGLEDAEVGYELPIPELARRMAEVQLIVAEGADGEVMIMRIGECIHGAGAQLVSWTCERGHVGRALALDVVTELGCPLCGAPLKRMDLN